MWVATEKGLCSGLLESNGCFQVQWKYGLAEGLAGESVRRIVLANRNLWYLTGGGGGMARDARPPTTDRARAATPIKDGATQARAAAPADTAGRCGRPTAAGSSDNSR